MNIKPQISIIIPSFNNIDDLKVCINSIKIQTFKNYEVWIIDNKSTDGTEKYLKSLKQPFNWLFEKDMGIYDAMNKGIKACSGDWLYFLGCDDRLVYNKTLENVFNNNTHNFDLIIGKIEYDLTGNETHFMSKNKGVVTSSMSRKIWLRNTMHHQGVFYRKSIFSELEYSIQYKVLSDYNLNIKLFKQGVKKLIINDKIALCNTKGISKNYNWRLYKEEIDLKTNNSSSFFKPIFYLIGFGKYLIKKII